MKQPWVDHMDLTFIKDAPGAEYGFENAASIGLYRWRDTDVKVTIDNSTMEILDIYDQS